jgi:hypothetical protein
MAGQFESVAKGHDFSRAANAAKRSWASAPGDILPELNRGQRQAGKPF